MVSDSRFSLGKNDKVNTFELMKKRDKPKSHKAVVQPAITHKTLAHEEEKVALVLLSLIFVHTFLLLPALFYFREKYLARKINLQFLPVKFVASKN